MNDTGLVVRIQRKRYLLVALFFLAVVVAGTGGYLWIEQRQQAELQRLNENAAQMAARNRAFEASGSGDVNPAAGKAGVSDEGQPRLVIQSGNLYGSNREAMSRDGRLLLTANEYDDLRLWDAATATLLRRFPDFGETDYRRIEGMDFLPDANAILVWYRSKERSRDDLTLWDTRRGTLLRTIMPCKTGQISSMALSRNGHLAAIACSKGDVALWDIQNGALLRSFPAGSANRKAPIDIVAMSPDGGMMLTASEDPASSQQETLIFDTASGRKICDIQDQRPILSCFARRDRRFCQLQAARNEASRIFSLDGRSILLQDAESGDAVTWDVGRCIATARVAPPGGLIAASARNPRALSRLPDSSLALWDVSTGTRVASLARRDSDNDRPQVLDVSADGGSVIVKRGRTEAVLWSTVDGTMRAIPQKSSGGSFEFTSGGQGVLAADADYPVRFWQETAKAWREVSPAGKPTVSRLIFGHDGRSLQVVYSSSMVEWDLASGRGTLIYINNQPASGADTSPDGRWKAVNSRDENGGVELRDARTGTLLVTLYANQSPTSSRAETLALAPDGRFVVNTDPRRLLARVRGTTVLPLDDDIARNQRSNLTELLAAQNAP